MPSRGCVFTRLECASKELRNDKDVVLEAVKNNGSSLKFASEELQDDKEVVLEAVCVNRSIRTPVSVDIRTVV